MRRVLLITAFMVVLYMALRPAPPKESRTVAGVEATSGDIVCRPDNKPWAPHGQSAIVIVSLSTCGACAARAPFDEEIYQYGRAHGIPVFYVMNDAAANDQRAKDLRAGGRVVLRQTLADFGITRVPTVLRVSDSGLILSSWTGTVPAGRHDEVFESVISGTSLQAYARIQEPELRSYARGRKVQVLAFSEIGEDPSLATIVIPPEDVYVRARHEFDPEVPIVVDCGSSLKPSVCQSVVLELLATNRYKQITVSGLPRRSNRCK